MAQFQIRFNKARGQVNRGTMDHVWRVFEDEKEYLFKNICINVSSRGQKTGEDWSICCEGVLKIDRETSTGTVEQPLTTGE